MQGEKPTLILRRPHTGVKHTCGHTSCTHDDAVKAQEVAVSFVQSMIAPTATPRFAREVGHVYIVMKDATKAAVVDVTKEALGLEGRNEALVKLLEGSTAVKDMVGRVEEARALRLCVLVVIVEYGGKDWSFTMSVSAP